MLRVCHFATPACLFDVWPFSVLQAQIVAVLPWKVKEAMSRLEDLARLEYNRPKTARPGQPPRERSGAVQKG